MNLTFSSLRKKKASLNHAATAGGAGEVQTNKILRQARSDVKAIMSDWFRVKVKLSLEIPNIAINGQGLILIFIYISSHTAAVCSWIYIC